MSNEGKELYYALNKIDGKVYKLTREQALHLRNTGEFPEDAPLAENQKVGEIDVEQPAIVDLIKKFLNKVKSKVSDNVQYTEDEIKDDIKDDVEETVDMDVGSLTFDDLFKDLPNEEYLDKTESSLDDLPEEMKNDPMVQLIMRFNRIAASSIEPDIVESNLTIIRELTYNLDKGESMCVHELIARINRKAMNVLANSNLTRSERNMIVSFTDDLNDSLIRLFGAH